MIHHEWEEGRRDPPRVPRLGPRARAALLGQGRLWSLVNRLKGLAPRAVYEARQPSFICVVVAVDGDDSFGGIGDAICARRL